MAQIIANGIIVGSVYALIAIGFSLIYRTVRFFHFAHGAVYAVAAYAGWALHTYSGLPFLVCVLAGCIVGAVLGVGIQRAVYEPLGRRGAPQLVFLLASFAVFIFLSGVLQLAFGGDVQVYAGRVVREGRQIAGAIITDHQLLIIGTCILASVSLYLWLARSSLGKAIRAVSDDPIAASLMGINTKRITMFVFGVGSGLAGLAGVLISVETNLNPAMGFDAILKGIVAALIGGIGNIYGAILGGLILGLAENLGVVGISAGWKDTVAFVLLTVFLLARPGGLFGSELEQRQV